MTILIIPNFIFIIFWITTYTLATPINELDTVTISMDIETTSQTTMMASNEVNVMNTPQTTDETNSPTLQQSTISNENILETSSIEATKETITEIPLVLTTTLENIQTSMASKEENVMNTAQTTDGNSSPTLQTITTEENIFETSSIESTKKTNTEISLVSETTTLENTETQNAATPEINEQTSLLPPNKPTTIINELPNSESPTNVVEQQTVSTIILTPITTDADHTPTINYETTTNPETETPYTLITATTTGYVVATTPNSKPDEEEMIKDAAANEPSTTTTEKFNEQTVETPAPTESSGNLNIAFGSLTLIFITKLMLIFI